MKSANAVIDRAELGDAWLKYVRELRPKPHFVKHNGKWQACYGNQCKGSKYRVQMVIAEDVNPFVAHCKYLEALDPQGQTAARIARGGKFNMNIITIAWRRLMGKI